MLAPASPPLAGEVGSSDPAPASPLTTSYLLLTTSQRSEAEHLAIEDKNSLLLGIKYEAARLGGVEGEPLRTIEEQLQAEVGEGWQSDEQVLKGRNAVRDEHDLPPVGETERRPVPGPREPRPLWRRVLGR